MPNDQIRVVHQSRHVPHNRSPLSLCLDASLAAAAAAAPLKWFLQTIDTRAQYVNDIEIEENERPSGAEGIE